MGLSCSNPGISMLTRLPMLNDALLQHLDAVFPPDGVPFGFVRGVRRRHLGEFLDEGVKASRYEDRQGPAGRLSGIPKCMRDGARKNRHRTGRRGEKSVTAADLERPLQNVIDLVFPAMHMQRNAVSGLCNELKSAIPA